VGTSSTTMGHSPGSGGTLTHAFLYRRGRLTDLGTLGFQESFAQGINRAGQVVGYAVTGAGEVQTGPRAFLYDSSGMRELPTLGGRTSGAYGINDAGQVVGWSTTDLLPPRAFLFSAGQVINLGTLDLEANAFASDANGINARGQVVGSSTPRDASGNPGSTRAVLWDNGQIVALSSLGGSWSEARSINASGQIVGGAELAVSALRHAVLWSQGNIADLGTLGGPQSFAYGINADGLVVGNANTSGDPITHAFLWAHGQMKDLNSLLPARSGWQLEGASGINDAGQIVGGGLHEGKTRAFLMTPAR
jgi:probable HAF family extracellular repeat protein